MQARLAGLFPLQHQALGVPHDLADPSVAEQVGAHGRRLTGPPVAGGAQVENADNRPLGVGLDDLSARTRSIAFATTIRAALGREEEGLVVRQVVPVGPYQHVAGQAGVRSRRMGRLHRMTRVLRFESMGPRRRTSHVSCASASPMRAPVAQSMVSNS